MVIYVTLTVLTNVVIYLYLANYLRALLFFVYGVFKPIELAKMVKIFLFKLKNIFFHKGKYVLSIWHSLFIRSDKFNFRQTVVSI